MADIIGGKYRVLMVTYDLANTSNRENISQVYADVDAALGNIGELFKPFSQIRLLITELSKEYVLSSVLQYVGEHKSIMVNDFGTGVVLRIPDRKKNEEWMKFLRITNIHGIDYSENDQKSDDTDSWDIL
ncbi:hypothetical protein [Niveispirillum sp. KHB5.9]|uniref:hypothetical protein n=1 Tax=Niveispirillum sp. KHB5.9 TaxID=3400269 RepID=UPI003A8C88FC